MWHGSFVGGVPLVVVFVVIDVVVVVVIDVVVVVVVTVRRFY